ncbi:MAG TPA: PilZ domain-containing protein [Terriglobales bacterium]|nr:PilZ domain-containing protein [Terriglobales bacterium]
MLRLLMGRPPTERRRRKRVPVQVPVSIRTGSAGEEASGYTRDLSEGGIFLYTTSQVAEGSELEIVLVLPSEITQGEKRWVCCQASIVRIEEEPEGGRRGVAADIQRMEFMPEIPR